jgi:hypothetical protein
MSMSNTSKSGVMTQSEYARHRQVNRSYINRLVKKGILIMRGKRINVAASDAVLDDKPVDVEPPGKSEPGAGSLPTDGGGGSPPPSSFAQARTAEMIFRARLRKLDYETKTGKLIPADDVKVAWFAIGHQIRDKLLGLPAKLAPQLAALNDVREVRDLLDAEIEVILRALMEELRYERR